MTRKTAANHLLSLSFCFLIAATAPSVAQAPADGEKPQTPPVLLKMIRDDSVHQELRLSETQVDRLTESLKAIDGVWFRSRNLPAAQQAAQVEMATARLKSKLADLLDVQQMERLKQLVVQALGTRMIVEPEVAEALEMRDSLHRKLLSTFVETDRKSADIQQQLNSGSFDAEEAAAKIAKLQENERQAFSEALTKQQRLAIGKLTGPPFDFSGIQRTYPLAPELVSEGVTWLQGDPISLADLRGKVVAVHFYAFQCINCKRNLPHYNGWYKDYGDQGLVVIGIQRPETSAERNPERVSAAIKNDQMHYPVMLDLESANWNQWSNTMWPTVYLVDKKGFLRRWWQGEMNWKGTPGEQQMRQTIEQLLAE